MSTQNDDAGRGVSRAREAISGQAAAAAQAKDAPWRVYPSIDKALESEEPAVMARIEKTCRELDRIARTGHGRESERAKAALTAYGRALDLFRRLVELRDKAISESAGSPGRQES
ncbi:MAG TPA: hypothetical protein VN428_02175 [Bryobacteraceae bacterium]|nr:hypothetical protein [Bryobacteraceae bacterium]